MFFLNKYLFEFFTFMIIFIILLLEPVGFDLFYHIFYLLEFDRHITYNVPHSVTGFSIDRYIYFPYIIHISPFPVLFSIGLITFLAWRKSFKYIWNNSGISSYLLLVIFLYNVVFWTPLTISFGFLLSSYIYYKEGRQKYFTVYVLASFFFHPMSAVLFIFLALFLFINNTKLFKNLTLLSLFCVLVFLSSGILFNSTFFDPPVLIESLTPQNPAVSTFVNSYSLVRDELSGIYELFNRVFSKAKILLIFIMSIILVSINFDKFRISKLITTFFSHKSIKIIMLSVLLPLMVYKSLTNGSVLTASFVTLNSSQYVDYSIELAKNSIGITSENKVIFRDGFSQCFWVFPKFSINESKVGYHRSCFDTELYTQNLLLIDLLTCKDVLYPNSPEVMTIYKVGEDNFIAHYNLNIYMPDYNKMVPSPKKLICTKSVK